MAMAAPTVIGAAAPPGEEPLVATTDRTASRAGINVRHLQYGANGSPGKGESMTQPDRRRLLQECLRHLDPELLEKQAARNKSIVPEDSYLNYGGLNDGRGGFADIADLGDIEEAVAYGDSRIGNVFRKINDRTFETTTIVSFLPKSLCDEIPDYYPVMQKQPDGTEKVVAHRSRWVPKDMDATKQYFEDLIEYLETDVINGGHDAISGFAVNMDESVPHIHVMCDTFAPDPKHPDHLRVEAQQMWGQHREVTEEREDPETGEKKAVVITGRTKMKNYQENLRQFMTQKGYNIEAEADPVRSTNSGSKDEYAAAQTLVLQAEAMGEEANAELGAAAQEREETEMLAASVRRDVKRAEETTERLTKSWEAEEKPRVVADAQDAARADWEATGRPQAVAEAQEAGRQAALIEARREFETTEKPKLVKATEADARRNSKEVEKPKLVERFNEQVNAAIPKYRAKAKKDGEADAKAAARAELQERLDAAEADRTAAAKELEAAQAVRENALQKATADFETTERPKLRAQAKADGEAEARAELQAERDAVAAHKDTVTGLLATVDGLVTEVEESASTVSETLTASDGTFRTLRDMGKALPPDQQKKFFEVTQSRFGTSVDRLRALTPDGKLLGERVKDLRSSVEAARAQLVDEDDGTGKPKGGDPQPGS